ncbi:NAD(+)/NADH kinase [bacterium]|nr:NAD(+)/NADH kinase [FCB group bacterium]MBL7190657.1 NAD(+)/NADH kinase [bacterium]
MLLGIISNTGKKETGTILPEFLSWLKYRGVEFIADEELQNLLKDLPKAYYSRGELAPNCDVILSFGGDGTLLSTARAMGAHETPILGVNIGGLGYLAEVSPQELKDKIKGFLAGHFRIEERMLLEAKIEYIDKVEVFYALNDVVVDKGNNSRLIQLSATINNEFFNTYYADGLIIATPTGSTGYSLSAGGPILEPTLEGIIIIPICPHSLSQRPIVISPNKLIEIALDPTAPQQAFICDGFLEKLLPAGSRVSIQRSERVVNLIIMKGNYFYNVLRKKLHWGI